MGKLHELLAVEGDLKARAQTSAADVRSLFRDGQGKFLGQVIVYRPLDENERPTPAKVTHVATTVKERLDAIGHHYTAWIDASIQKEQTNQETKAVLAIGDNEITLAATSLLNIEAKLLELRAIYRDIPTNDVTAPWAMNEGTGYYESEPDVRSRTKKVMRSHVSYEATKEHPAQVSTYNEDVVVGHVTATSQSGMITPKEKQARLDRLEALIQDVKRARQRANDIEVKSINIGGMILDHINGE